MAANKRSPNGVSRRTLNVRDMDNSTLEQMKLAAGARGMSLRQYLTALVLYHQRTRGNPAVASVLKELKLEEVKA